VLKTVPRIVPHALYPSTMGAAAGVSLPISWPGKRDRTRGRSSLRRHRGTNFLRDIGPTDARNAPPVDRRRLSFRHQKSAQ